MANSRSEDTIRLESLVHAETQQEPQNLENHDDNQERNHQSLEPLDGGAAAWKLLLAAFVFESLLWGFPLSFGVFQNYYSQLPQFENQPFVSVIGTVASGIAYMGAPFVIPSLKRFPRYHRQMIWVGWSVCILAVLAASFVDNLASLIFTQGVMYGFGFITFYYPILSMVNEYWIARRGMAYGLLCSASGVSGIAMPFTLEALLNKYGYQTTLRALAIGLAVLTGPLLPALKGRVPASEQSVVPRTSWTFLRAPLFWAYTASNLLQGLGYFFPSLYIPSYARAIGLSSMQGALLLASMSVSQVAGQFSFGYLSDRSLSLNILTLVSTTFSAVAIFSLWGLARSFPVLMVFVLAYGFFGAGYVAMWARMGTAITSEATSAFATFGLFCFGKGIGNVLAGPISASLVQSSVDVHKYGTGKYESIILFAGSCMLGSAIMIPMSYLRL